MSKPIKAIQKTPATLAHAHDEGKDLRRAYEHRARVEILRSMLGKNSAPVDVLISLGEAEAVDANCKHAADLFRAAEHLSFGILESANSSHTVNAALVRSTKAEFDHKLEKANEHCRHSDALGDLYRQTLEKANTALTDGAWFKALELVLAAEAMAHVSGHENHERKTAA